MFIPLSWETTCLERPQNLVVAWNGFHCSFSYLDCFMVLTVSRSPSWWTYLSIATYLPRLLHSPDCFTVSTLCMQCVRLCSSTFWCHIYWYRRPRVFWRLTLLLYRGRLVKGNYISSSSDSMIFIKCPHFQGQPWKVIIHCPICTQRSIISVLRKCLHVAVHLW